MSDMSMHKETSSCMCHNDKLCCCGMHMVGSLPYKSMAASILLTFFLGPIGLLYSSFWVALILTLLIIPGLFIPARVATPVVCVLWLVCIFIGSYFTRRYNKKLLICSYQNKDKI